MQKLSRTLLRATQTGGYCCSTHKCRNVGVQDRLTVSLGVTSVVAYTYGCGDGRISPTHCAVIDGALGDRCKQLPGNLSRKGFVPIRGSPRRVMEDDHIFVVV